MARVTNKELLAGRQDAGQPVLFDDSQLPVEFGVLELVKSKRYEFTGARLTDDETKCLRLVELLVARWGVKKIAAEMHISPHTVRAARRALTLQGKLAPLQQRIIEKMEDVIETGLDCYLDALEAGRVNASQIPVPLGVIFDKRQLAMGQATSITQRQTGGEEISEEKLNAYFAALPQALATADSQSTESALIPEGNGGLPSVDVTLDATTHRPAGLLPVPGPGPAASASERLDGSAAGAPDRPRGAGGVSDEGGGV